MTADSNTGYLSNLKDDLPASVVVFLVAVPLCLGIALASNAPLIAGVIAGIVGGIVVGLASGSQLSVSGPAAGLTVIVATAIKDLGTFQAFLLAVVIAGVLQLVFGFLKAGIIASFFPTSVIKGMLAAIGLIVILKQIPHAVGYDADYEGDLAFRQDEGETTFSALSSMLDAISPGALLIAAVSLCLILLWDNVIAKRIPGGKLIPGPLLAVIAGIVLNGLFVTYMPEWVLADKHLVALPIVPSLAEVPQFLLFPDFSQIANPKIYVAAFTIALIASIETLLSVEAVDKLDPYRRVAPTNRELKAQGLGNLIAGLIGGLPMTAVIVRSSANVNAGGKTKVSAIAHGVLLLLCALFIPAYLNMIPLAALAAVLLIVGYKLSTPALWRQMYRQGWEQFAPFCITVVAILFTDLLRGILIGIAVGIFFVIRADYHRTITVTQHKNNFLVRMISDVSFLNKAYLRNELAKIPPDASVVIDASRATFVDHDIVETIEDYLKTAPLNRIEVEINRTADAVHPAFRIQPA